MGPGSGYPHMVHHSTIAENIVAHLEQIIHHILQYLCILDYLVIQTMLSWLYLYNTFDHLLVFNLDFEYDNWKDNLVTNYCH